MNNTVEKLLFLEFGLWKLPRGRFEGRCGEIVLTVLLADSVKLWDFGILLLTCRQRLLLWTLGASVS